METGTKVYLCWYDFDRKREFVHAGEVVDNSMYAGTQWDGYVCVSFKPAGMAQNICYPFKPEQLSLTENNVPHDDCYLVMHKVDGERKQDEGRLVAETFSLGSAKDRLKEFMQQHWDKEHDHIRTESLEEYYLLWRAFIMEEHGIKDKPETAIKQEPQRIVSDERMEILKEQLKSNLASPAKRKKESNAVQLSLF